MKKTKTALFMAAIIAAAICLTACGGKKQSVSGTMTLVVGTEIPTVYSVDLDSVEITDGALSVLEYLSKTQGLEYASQNSTIGTYLTEVGDLKESTSQGIYILIYTSVEEDFDVTEYASDIDYNGNKLVSSGVGVSEMTLKKDCIIYIGTIKFGL